MINSINRVNRESEIIERIPSAEPERKTGRWVLNEKESEKHIEKIYNCSACMNFEAWGETELYKYCPNCGQCQDWNAVWLHEKEILNGRDAE